MPNHKSCEKRLRQDKVRNARNHFVKSTIATLTKTFKTKEMDKTQMQEALNTIYSKLDKAAKRGIIHKRTANRRKAGLREFFNKSIKE